MRAAVTTYFAVLGFVCTAWISSLDDLKALLGLTAAQQGWLLLSGPLGNLVSFTFVSRLLLGIGARRGLVFAGVGYLLSAALLALCFAFRAPVACWCLTIALFGLFGNVYNIAANTQGGTVERRLGRTIMSSFHAVFSLMCLTGGLLTLVAAAADVPVAARFTFVLVVSALALLVAARRLPPDEASAVACKSRACRPDRPLFMLGLAALVIMGCEGAVSDWVGVYYRESLHVTSGAVKLGFCAVTGLMTVGRFLTDGFVDRFGAASVFRSYCLFVFFGLALALSAPFLGLAGGRLVSLATAGFAVSGFGISGLVPILYSRANRTTSMPPASALTFVGSMGFLGYFVAPVLIGQLAEVTCYSVALGLFALGMLFCLFLAPSRSRF